VALISFVLEVVPKHSAILREYASVGIHSNHMDMTKFEGEDDPGSLRVVGELQVWVKDLKQLSAKNLDLVYDDHGFRIPLKLPFAQNPNFVGRQSEISEIHRCLALSAENKQRITLIFGTGGMGKSQVALQYAYLHHKFYSAIFWIDAGSTESIEHGFRDGLQRVMRATERRCSPEEASREIGVSSLVGADGQLSNKPEIRGRIVQVLTDWLTRDLNNNWLLIFDNYDDLDTFQLSGYFPGNLAGRILITSRRQECQNIASHSIELGSLGESEAISLLLGDPVPVDVASDRRNMLKVHAARQIVEEMHHFPLAISQAHAYIQARQIELKEYLRRYRTMFREVVRSKPREPWTYGETTFTTWEISFEAIKAENPEAADLLLLCSFLNSDDIWEDLLRKGLDYSEDGKHLMKTNLRISDHIVDFTLENQIEPLLSYSLIKRQTDKSCLWIHPVVHAWARERLNGIEKAEKIKSALEILGKAVYYASDRRETTRWALESRVLPHIYAFLKYTWTVISRQKDYSLLWLDWIGNALRDRGDAKTAEVVIRWVLEEFERTLGKDHPSTLNNVSNLAGVLRDQGKYEEAEEMNRRALEGREKVLGKEHPDTLTGVSNLAWVLQHQGKYKEAEEKHRRALEGREKVLGMVDPSTLACISNLASLLQHQGKYWEAEAMNRRALEWREKVLGKEHPDTLTSISNLAWVLQHQGKYKEAEEMCRLALEGREKVLGMEHPDTLASVSNLASVLRDQGKYEEAEQMNGRVLEWKEMVLGREHSETLTSARNLALVLRDQGKYEEAELMSRRVLEWHEKVMGMGHPDTLTISSNLALVLQYQGKYEEAEEVNRQTLQWKEMMLGMGHPDTLTSVSTLASVLQDQGKYEEAEVMRRRALEYYDKVIGREHPSTLTSLSNLALVLQAQGKYDEAEDMHRRALEGMERALGKEHPDTLACVRKLASILQYQGKYKETEELNRQVLEGKEKALKRGSQTR
jgi:tetratricopeptide (TPR) repeat protein